MYIFKFYLPICKIGAIYNSWNVLFQLRPTSGSTSTTVSWSRASVANLRNALPISSSGKYQVVDRLSVPTNLAGTYPILIFYFILLFYNVFMFYF